MISEINKAKIPKGCLPVLIIIIILIGWMWHNANTISDDDIFASAHTVISNKMLSPTQTTYAYDEDKIIWHDGNKYIVFSITDAPNAFGVKLRQSYLVAFIQVDKSDCKSNPFTASRECSTPPTLEEIGDIKRENGF